MQLSIIKIEIGDLEDYMKITKLSPQGYCQGVRTALNRVIKAIKDESIPKPIYLLGPVIHNDYANKIFTDNGAIIIQSKSKSRLELLDEIPNGTVIFSAHGVSPAVVEKALIKGLHIIDASCGKVKIIHNKINKYLKLNYTCIYIGTLGHPESEAVLGLSDKIILIQNISDLNSVNINNDNIYVTNQTTLSIIDTKNIYEEILKRYPNAITDNNICDATTKRQLAVLNQEPCDLCIVVGDSKSSNTKKLASISRQVNIPTLLIESVDNIIDYDFSNINSISITSGASTPSILVYDIIKHLEKISS